MVTKTFTKSQNNLIKDLFKLTAIAALSCGLIATNVALATTHSTEKKHTSTKSHSAEKKHTSAKSHSAEKSKSTEKNKSDEKNNSTTKSDSAAKSDSTAKSDSAAKSDSDISSKLNVAKSIMKQNPTMDHEMVILGVSAYNWAQKHAHVGNSGLLTLIDFTKPSYEKRMYVINMHSYKTVLNTAVAHGKNSGATYATSFSNKSGSDATSLGVYVTQQTFMGHHGLSLHIEGLEKGLNDNASRRAVEIHCAAYVSDAYIKSHHRAGRSWGCFALSPAVCHKVAKMLAGGSVIFAYALPEEKDKNLQ